MANVVCAACRRSIDAAAKTCPYCGADPITGERIDTQALMQEIFRPKEMSTTENVMEYARQRQGVVVGVSILVAFLILAGLHQFATMRNDSNTSNATAVPLTEIADLTNQPNETQPQAMPELEFQYDGKPQRMRTYIIERGAIPPPEVIAAQQAAAAAKAAAPAPGTPGAVRAPGPPAAAPRTTPPPARP